MVRGFVPAAVELEQRRVVVVPPLLLVLAVPSAAHSAAATAAAPSGVHRCPVDGELGHADNDDDAEDEKVNRQGE